MYKLLLRKAKHFLCALISTFKLYDNLISFVQNMHENAKQFRKHLFLESLEKRWCEA